MSKLEDRRLQIDRRAERALGARMLQDWVSLLQVHAYLDSGYDQWTLVHHGHVQYDSPSRAEARNNLIGKLKAKESNWDERFSGSHWIARRKSMGIIGWWSVLITIAWVAKCSRATCTWWAECGFSAWASWACAAWEWVTTCLGSKSSAKPRALAWVSQRGSASQWKYSRTESR